jgi:hypothetical protein
MDNNRLFKWLWRANAVLLACAAVLVILDSARGEIRRFRDRYFPPEVAANMQTYVETEEGDAVLEASWRYGNLRKLPGGDFLIPLYMLGGSEDGRHSSLRNFVFLDAHSENCRRLLPDNTSSVFSYELLTTSDYEHSDAVLYEILDGEEISIYLSRTNGEGLVEIVDNVDRYVNFVIDDDYLMVFYVKASRGWVARVDLSDLTVTAMIELPEAEY